MTCWSCERCLFSGPDCGIAEHEHCDVCGHCFGRHGMPSPRPLSRAWWRRVWAVLRSGSDDDSTVW